MWKGEMRKEGRRGGRDKRGDEDRKKPDACGSCL
jgi:hypothetical protein